MSEELSTQLCACGCGEFTPLAKRTRKEMGHIKGKPCRFVAGHNHTREYPTMPTDEELWAEPNKTIKAWVMARGISRIPMRTSLRSRGWKRGNATNWSHAPCAVCGQSSEVKHLDQYRRHTVEGLCPKWAERDSIIPIHPAVALFRDELAKYRERRRAEFDAVKAGMAAAREREPWADPLRNPDRPQRKRWFLNETLCAREALDTFDPSILAEFTNVDELDHAA